MENNTLDDLYYSKDIKSKIEKNPFDLGRFMVLFFSLYNRRVFNITKSGQMRTSSFRSLSDEVMHRVSKLKALLDQTRLTMPDINSLMGHEAITASTKAEITECNVVDAIVVLHEQQVSHELMLGSLEASLNFEKSKAGLSYDEDKIEKLKSDISMKTDQRMLMLNYLKNIGESLEKHITSNLEDDLFKDEKDVTKESDLTAVDYEELRPTRRRKPISAGGRAKKPKY